MCGRARQPKDYSDIKIKVKFGNAVAPNLAPSWNIAPTQDMLCATYDAESKSRVPSKMHWGLIPRWSKEGKMTYPTFNARGDIVDVEPEFKSKATFKDAWKKGRRCLVITDGFYEWRKKDKQPYAIGCVDDSLTIMAGLWEEWRGPTSEVITSCTIITTNVNELLEPIHDRMPVILAEKDWPAWLGEVPASESDLKSLLAPYPSADMTLWPVDKRVGNVRNNDSQLIAPIDGVG